MKLPAAPLARPTTEARWEPQAPRRGELSAQERKDLVWILEDYAEMLESCAVGIDDGGPIDRETLDRAARARAFANRLK